MTPVELIMQTRIYHQQYFDLPMHKNSLNQLFFVYMTFIVTSNEYPLTLKVEKANLFIKIHCWALKQYSILQ